CFKNVGSRGSPELAEPVVLVPPPDGTDGRGVRSKICVTDWNGDGRFDLLVGDFGEAFHKELSDEEIGFRDEVRRRQADLFSQWAVLYREYRNLTAAGGVDTAPADRQQRL